MMVDWDATNQRVTVCLGGHVFDRIIIANGIVIEGHETWDEPILCEGNITIGDSDSLTLAAGCDLAINGNIIVNDGGTFIIEGGVDVQLGEDNKIIVNGKLYAVGTANDMIDFYPINPNLLWDYILIDHTDLNPTTDSEIKYCHISRAEKGIKAVSTSKLVIENCTIEDNTAGIYCSSGVSGGVNPKIKQNTIKNNTTYGIAAANMGTSGQILENILEGNSNGNVYLNNSSPHYYGDNAHIGPAAYGLYCDGDASPWMMYSDGIQESGYNSFDGNTIDIITVNNGRPILGRWEEGFYYPGYNCFAEQDSFMLDNRGELLIYAEVNYWNGEDEPDTTMISNVNLVDCDSCLAAPESRSERFLPGPDPIIKNNQGQICSATNLLFEADDALFSGNPTSAMTLYTQALSQNPSEFEAMWAVWGLNQAYQAGAISLSIGSQLQSIGSTFSNNAVGIFAQFLSMGLTASTNPTSAISQASSLIAQNIAPDWGKQAFFQQAMLEKYHLRNVAAGDSLFTLFIQEYPNEELTILAYLELGLTPPEIAGKGLNDNLSTFLPEEFAFHPSFPNPFNPTTTFHFSLPHQSKVILEVYNVMGQKVIQLVDGVRMAGQHYYNWDIGRGKTPNLASGMYFCRLKATSLQTNERFEKVQKVLLLK